MKEVDIDKFLKSDISEPLFKNTNEAIKCIESYVGSSFIQDRVLTSEEYQKIKEATIWLFLNSN